jgi:hypothetical protein
MSVFDEIGDFLGTSNKSAIDDSINSLDEIKAYADSVSAKNNRLYNDYYGQMNDTYGANASKYNNAVSNLADAIANYKEFEYTGGVNDFLDPARNQRVAAAMSAINNSSASGGNRFSSNYLDKLAAKQQSLASEEWRAAYDRMMQDRSQQLAEWQSRQNKINNMGTLAGLYGNDRDKLSDAIGNYYTNLANQNNADLSVMSDVTQGKANLNAQRSNGVGDLVGNIATIVGSIFG